MTNFELIKTTNVEEFAKLFGDYSLCYYIKMSDSFHGCADFDDCEECLKKFLLDDYIEKTMQECAENANNL